MTLPVGRTDTDFTSFKSKRGRPDLPSDWCMATALDAGCSRVEAAMWSLIASRFDAEELLDPTRFLAAVRHYVDDRNAGTASFEVLVRLLKHANTLPPCTWTPRPPASGHGTAIRRGAEDAAAGPALHPRP